MANNKPIDKNYLVKQLKNYETEIIDKKYVAKDSVATTLEEEVTDEQVASALLAKTELDKKVDKTSIVTELSEESTNDEVVGALTTYNELQKLESANKKQFATASGNFITVNDSVDGNIVDLKLYGKSEQKQYTGKNLLDCSGLETATIYGVTFTPVYKNGMLQYINVNGTASNDIAFLVSNQFSLDNGIYKLSGCTNGSDSTYRLQLWRDGIGTIRVYNNDVQFDFKQVSNNVAIYVVNGATVSNVKFYPMIRLATVEDSTYEPYVSGIPSPNPDYPQEIKSVVNPVVKAYGKNLLDVNSPNLILNGYLVDRNIQYSTDFNISDYIPVEPSTSYCLQPFLKIAAKYVLYDKNKNYITGYELAELLDRKGVFTTTSKTRYIRVSILKSNQNKYQLELGTKATSYEPYTEKAATLPYTLNAIPVSSGGNVTIDGQQYIADYVDFEKKQLVRMCKKNDFSNIKSLYIKHGDSDIKDKYAYYSDNDVLPNAKNGIAICSKFITDTNIDNLYYSGIYGHFAINNNGFWFGGGDIITNVSEAIDVLKSDGSYVIYALSIPETIDLTNEEVQAFRDLTTYYPTTNVFVSSDQLDGYAELKYPTTDVSGLASRNESRIAELAKDTDDKFDDVNESLGTLEFGEVAGDKNLFRKYDYMGHYAFIDETYNGYPVIYSSDQWDGARQTNLVLETGKTYTVSAYVKGSGEVGLFYGSMQGTELRKTLTSDWQKVVWTFTPDAHDANTDSGSNNVRIEQIFKGMKTYISCFQIEEGDAATPYKPYIPSVKMLTEEVDNVNASLEAQNLDNKYNGWSQLGTDTKRIVCNVPCDAKMIIHAIPNFDILTVGGSVYGFYNSSNELIGNMVNFTEEIKVNAPSNAKYVRFLLYKSDGFTNYNYPIEIYVDNPIDILKNDLAASNAGAHNCVYRGKYLGNALTTEQKTQISAGTFNDLYIGDYWTIGGVNYRIAAFDYWLNSGDINCATHHAVIIPDRQLYTHVMNDTNIITGGYVGSKIYTEGLEQAKTIIKEAFGEANILIHREYFTNATTNGYASGGAWYDSEVDLMNENMIYGSAVFRPQNSLGATIPNSHTIDKSILPLFQFRPDLISNRQWYWLRDVINATRFACVDGYGTAAYNDTSNSGGVRPAFGIVGGTASDNVSDSYSDDVSTTLDITG